MFLCVLLPLAALSPAVPALPPDIQLIGAISIPGDTTDRSGLTEPLAPGLPHNLVGSFGSGLTYSGRDNLYYACADRGPADGAHRFRDRLHTLRITLTPDAPAPLACTVESTLLLRDPSGAPYLGYSGVLATDGPAPERRLDPEGLVVLPSGNIITCDEYGPWLDEWTPAGIHIRRLPTPSRFLGDPAIVPAAESSRPPQSSGRQPNRGFEGLTLSADRAHLYAIMQGPLLQDHALDAGGKRAAINLRLLELDLSPDYPKPSREFVYRLDSPAHGVNEILALDPDTFLVLEKDSKGGDKAKCRSIYRISLRGATDVSGRDSLPGIGLPPEVEPVDKELFLDMLEPRFGLAGPAMPEKVESLAFGPNLPDGRRLLLVASDNDYDPRQPSWIWAFSIGLAAAPAPTPAPAH